MLAAPESYRYNELPSVEDIHVFMDFINHGREAVGLERIEKLDFDASEPGSSTNCLSAHHLFGLVGGCVQPTTVGFDNSDTLRTLARAFGAETEFYYSFRIPQEILTVTNPFDSCSTDCYDTLAVKAQAERQLARLRERMVEAGVVV